MHLPTPRISNPGPPTMPQLPMSSRCRGISKSCWWDSMSSTCLTSSTSTIWAGAVSGSGWPMRGCPVHSFSVRNGSFSRMLERAINCVLITHGSSTYPTWETSRLDSSGEGRVKNVRLRFVRRLRPCLGPDAFWRARVGGEGCPFEPPIVDRVGCESHEVNACDIFYDDSGLASYGFRGGWRRSHARE